NFGRLLAKLDELGLRENTIVVFLTDNGPQQPRYVADLNGRKGSVYEGGIRVPCFVQWPAAVKGGRQIDTIAAHIDWLPTLLDICGVAAPQDVQIDGRSLKPLLTTIPNGKPRPAVAPDSSTARKLFLQCHRSLEPKRYQNAAVVTQRFKLVFSPDAFGREDFTPTDPPRMELYDLAADPGETQDVAEEHPDVVTELRGAYDRWFDEMRAARKFEPGVIVLGTKHENPAVLCLYQDATWRDGRPQGWNVRIAEGGRYRLDIHRGEETEPGTLVVTWQGETQRRPLENGETAATFDLSAGTGTLDIRIEDSQGNRVPPMGNSTVGDVRVERLKTP
ncbi:MAG: sulfatase/phosphatase domain-containing protein, partial [Planctomycetaceae bacterium]